MGSAGKPKPASQAKKSSARVVFTSRELQAELSGSPAARYRLRLYVAGNNLNSFHAIKSVRQFCDEFLRDRAELEIIDLYQQPQLARRDHVVAAPALIKISPAPRRMFIGDMTNTRRILAGLGISLQS